LDVAITLICNPNNAPGITMCNPNAAKQETAAENDKAERAATAPLITTKIVSPGDDTPMLDFRNATEWVSFVVGAILLICVGPPVGIVVFASMIWEAIDRKFDGGFVDSGKELSGFLFATCIPWLTSKTQTFNAQFVKRAEDAYMINAILAYGGLVPLMFFACAYHVQKNGLCLWLAFVYHLIRIGPFFMNFAYVYTLCHKEGHAKMGLFSKGYNDSIFFRNVFNWWIGMFYGVLPATFAYGHTVNHHKYNNNEYDVITTSDKPRDNFFNWVAYLARYGLYAVNVSTVAQFARENNWKTVWKVILGSLWFVVWIALCGVMISPTFALAYVAFPYFEALILLAAVNWSWHAFVDPNNPENEYVQSITILDGTINVLNEDSHVVHHQIPGAHWTDHPAQQEKKWDGYIENRASCFRTTHAFEIFGMSVARDYDALARKFVDLRGEKDGNPLSHEERVHLMKERLRGCWWGPRAVAGASKKND
jgi:Fatty acid desaturase